MVVLYDVFVLLLWLCRHAVLLLLHVVRGYCDRNAVQPASVLLLYLLICVVCCCDCVAIANVGW